MGELITPTDISEEDYRAIEEAVMETARGRWFLAEYANRNRVSETSRVLDAIDSLKSYITREHEPVDALQMRLDIVDMTQKIEQIKKEIANTEGNSPNISDAAGELNVVVDETEKATSTILSAAENIQQLAWEIRESGHSKEECEKVDEFTTEIYMACSFQDLTGQRLRKVVQLTSMIETRLNAMVSLWGETELQRYRDEPERVDEITSLTNGPAAPGFAQQQGDIDALMDSQSVPVEQAGINDIAWDDDDEPFIIDDEPFIADDKPFMVDDTIQDSQEDTSNIDAFIADASSEETDQHTQITPDIKAAEPTEQQASVETTDLETITETAETITPDEAQAPDIAETPDKLEMISLEERTAIFN